MSQFLLDTNILLCALIAPNRLSDQVRNQLSDQFNTVFFSAASIWEVAIKQSLGKADFNFSPTDIHALALKTGFTELAIQSTHTFAVATLPWHHRDPFDRLLVAQALSLPAFLLTSDTTLKLYTELAIVQELTF